MSENNKIAVGWLLMAVPVGVLTTVVYSVVGMSPDNWFWMGTLTWITGSAITLSTLEK